MKFVGLSPGACVRNLGSAQIGAQSTARDDGKQVLDFFAAGGGCCRTSTEVFGHTRPCAFWHIADPINGLMNS